MFKKSFFISLFLISSLYSKECSPYFNPDRFYESPDFLIELIEENIKNKSIEMFANASSYEKLSFEKKDDSYIKEIKHKKLNDYTYPLENGLWKYEIKDGNVDELYISKVELYKFSDSEIANELNNNFDGFWSDWIEDGYEMKLTPEQTLFKYKKYYFTFSVSIYGVKGDASTLNGTVVNYWFKNYTKEVNTYTKCMNN